MRRQAAYAKNVAEQYAAMHGDDDDDDMDDDEEETPEEKVVAPTPNALLCPNPDPFAVTTLPLP